MNHVKGFQLLACVKRGVGHNYEVVDKGQSNYIIVVRLCEVS